MGHLCRGISCKGWKEVRCGRSACSLRAMGATVRNNQELHHDIVAFASLLADHVILIEAACKSYKIQRGLVDFTDLETLFLEALSGDQLVNLIEEDFSLVLVDEFQDTNPLQLAIFQAIRKISPRSRWVGDPEAGDFRLSRNRSWLGCSRLGAFRGHSRYAACPESEKPKRIGRIREPCIHSSIRGASKANAS